MADKLRITITLDTDGMLESCTVERLGDASDVSMVMLPRRSRTPISDESLAAFAASYRNHYQPGQMQKLARRLGLSERQCWRLKKLAVQRGLLRAGQDQPRSDTVDGKLGGQPSPPLR